LGDSDKQSLPLHFLERIKKDIKMMVRVHTGSRDSQIAYRRSLSARAETVLQGCKPLSARAETVSQECKPFSACTETVSQSCKPLSARAETVLQECKPLSADSETIYTRLNILKNIILYL
jgi:hypothetical protein